MEKPKRKRARWKTTFAFANRAEYQKQYAQLPDVKEKNHIKWTSPEYKAKKRDYYHRVVKLKNKNLTN